MHMSSGILSELKKITPHSDSSKFFLQLLYARMSGDFDSRKDSQLTKLEKRPLIFIKLNFKELCYSKLSGLHPFDDMIIIH